jgi:predicted ester cyclase
MPSTERKRIVAEFIDTIFNKHELEAMSRFVANDRLVAAASALVKGNPDLRFDIQHLIAEEELVAIRVTGTGTHTESGWCGLGATGKTWQATCNAHYRVSNGKIVDFWINWDWLSIMQQLGAISLK